MAESVVSSVVEKIGNLLIEEVKFLHGVRGQVEELQRELNRMQWFFRDADAKKNEEDRIRQWILEVQDIAYDAEDLIESYAFKVGSWRDGGFMEVLNRCVCIFNECYLRHELGSEIQALNSKILKLKSSFQDYGVRDIMEKEGSTSRQQELRRTYSFVEEEDFVGLKSDVDLLVQNLVREDEHAYYRIVSISGMGGSGKTTLANKVYNHPTVKRYFARSAWICVSQQWQTKDILQRIMIKLVPDKKKEIEKHWREDELIRELIQVQQQKKSLIVLDDIWTVDAWECIKQAFPTGQRGSKILVTTRNREVALHIGPDGFHHQPRLLSKDESWDLLRRRALRGRYVGEHMNTNLNEMEELGKKMAERCGGLPLAVVVLGGILSTKITLNEWQTVHQNLKAHLWKGKSNGQDKGDIERILALSYKDLPYHLKPCFLYLSCFPEDTKIESETLYQLWIAEDMVSMKNRVEEESKMEVAERYLGELGQRGMVQLQIPELPGIRRFESCRLHDLMRDLCLREAEEEGFLKSINCSYGGADVEPFDSLSAASICKLRRLVINLETKDVCRYMPPKRAITKHLRMLQFVVQKDDAERLPKRFKSQFYSCHMLHVLSIEGLRHRSTRWCAFVHGWSLPRAIGKLIHLRYLSLRGSYFDALPSSLGKLKHLHTLDLRVYWIWRLPNILWKMEGLTCLYLPRWVRIKPPRCKLRLDGLSKLEILENFNDKYYYTKDLCKLNNLRVLVVETCWELKNLAMIADYAESTKTLQQVSIEVECDFALKKKKAQCDFALKKDKGLSVLKQLLFGRNIHFFKILDEFWKFPECEPNVTSGLVRLEIFDTWLKKDDDDVDVMVGTVEKLPLLRHLDLSEFDVKKMTFHATGFPQLRYLTLRNFRNLKTWVVEEGAMPNLRRLKINYFPELETIPDGLQFITTLEEFSISGMPFELERRMRTRDSEDFRKISHVPTVKIGYD